jgi:hypothetical protein
MAPIKSSLARSVSKLLGVFKDTDLSLRGDVQSSRIPIIPPVEASGGTEITSGTTKFHVFLGSSEQNFSVTTSGACEILVVAGGGSGGYFYGCGGGAGGIVHAPDFPVEAGVTYKVSAGNGAAARPSSPGVGNNGNPSYFKPSPAPAAASATNLFAMKGGGGGYSGDPEQWMVPILPEIGSSGGQVSPSDIPYRTPGFPGSTQHPTGVKYSNIGSADLPATRGGGGGGAGGGAGPNQDGSITTPASPGGAGRAFPSFPAPVIAPAIPAPVRPAWTPAVGPTGLFGGGGAGYAVSTVPDAPGGGGGWFSPSSDGTHAGVHYTGGGGAGPNPAPGAGGHGIVIVTYPTQPE